MPKPSIQATFGNNSQGGDNFQPQAEFVSVRRELMQQLMTSEPQIPMRGMEPSFGMEMEHRHSHPVGGLPMNFQRQGHPQAAPLSHRDSLTMGRMQHMSNINMEPVNHRGSMYHSAQFARGMSMPGNGSQSHYLASPQTPSRMASIAQQNQEDELLARLLMARRQRMQQQQQHPQHHQQQQQQQQQVPLHSSHHRSGLVDQGMAASDTHVLADDLLRLRQVREADAMLLAPPESPFAMRSPSMQMGPGVMGSPMDTSAMSNRSRHSSMSSSHRPSPMTESHLLRPSNLTSNTPGVLSQEIDDYLRKQEMRLRSPERVDRLPNRFPNMRAHELAQHQMELMMGAGRQAFDHLKIPSIEPTTNGTDSAKRKRVHKKKPADMPRRPLSAYNLFFSEERERILREIDPEQADAAAAAAAAEMVASPVSDDKSLLPAALLRPLVSSEKKRRPHRKTHGKIGFKLLAQMVGQRWKTLPDERRKYYQDLAEEDLKRHKTAMEDYYKKQSNGDADEKPSGDMVVNMDQGDDLDDHQNEDNDEKSTPRPESITKDPALSATTDTN